MADTTKIEWTDAPEQEAKPAPKKCAICNGLGYLRCDCWPGDCICGWDDEPCEACCETGHDGGCDDWE